MDDEKEIRIKALQELLQDCTANNLKFATEVYAYISQEIDALKG